MSQPYKVKLKPQPWNTHADAVRFTNQAVRWLRDADRHADLTMMYVNGDTGMTFVFSNPDTAMLFRLAH